MIEMGPYDFGLGLFISAFRSLPAAKMPQGIKCRKRFPPKQIFFRKLEEKIGTQAERSTVNQ